MTSNFLSRLPVKERYRKSREMSKGSHFRELLDLQDKELPESAIQVPDAIVTTLMMEKIFKTLTEVLHPLVQRNDLIVTVRISFKRKCGSKDHHLASCD